MHKVIAFLFLESVIFIHGVPLSVDKISSVEPQSENVAMSSTNVQHYPGTRSKAVYSIQPSPSGNAGKLTISKNL